MEAPKIKTTGNKINLRVTVSPYISEKMDTLVNKKKFSSVSDLVSVAVTKLLVEFQDEEVKA